ncbi:MAG: hypothetical protein ACJ757_13005 [Gaiellaceae bacterium]
MENAMRHHRRPGSCAEILRDPQADANRLAAVESTFKQLRGYRSLLQSVEQMNRDERDECPGLAEAITDRAYDAEAATRLLFAHGLQTANELRDTGELYRSLRGLAGDGLDSEALATRLDEQVEEAGHKHGDDIADLLREAASLVRETELSLRLSEQRIVLERPDLSGGTEEVGIALERQAGQLGRVSVERFFSPDAAHATIWPGRLYLPQDCHHRPLVTSRHPETLVDAYSGIVTGMASAKGALYQHARRTEEIGHRGMRGEDPITAVVLIAIAVVGVGLIIYGAVTGNGALIAFGAILVIGAALVAFGGFGLIIFVGA